MITFARNKQWLIPLTDDDSRKLCKLGLKLTKFDIDFVPTLKLILKHKKEKASYVDFQSVVLDPAISKLEKFWAKTENSKVKYGNCQIKLFGDNNQSNLQKLRTIENKLALFFERWGYEVDFIHNETATRCSLTIDYAFSSERLPVITYDDREYDADFDPAILEFGDYRLLIYVHTDCFGFAFEKKKLGISGDSFETIASQSKIQYSKLKSSHMIATLFELFNLQSMK